MDTLDRNYAKGVTRSGQKSDKEIELVEVVDVAALQEEVSLSANVSSLPWQLEDVINYVMSFLFKSFQNPFLLPHVGSLVPPHSRPDA